MTDEQNQQSEQEIQEILSDLDAILSDLAATSPDHQLLMPSAASALIPAPVVEAPPPKPQVIVEPATPVVLPPVALPPVQIKPPEPAPLEITSSAGLTIELAPREGTIKAPEKKTASAKPEVPVQLASQTKPPLEIKLEPEPSAPPAVIPEKTPKDQIRRIAVVYAPNFSKEKDEFIKFLDQCAQSFSKKPLFLRKVYVEIIQPGDNSRILLEKIKALGVVSLLGILDGLSDAKLKELSDVSAEGGLMFRSVAAADVKKKSIAVDIVVDMMLLSAEA